MTGYTGWPYAPKRYMCRVSFMPEDGRRPVVKTVVKGMNMDIIRKKALKIARSFFLHDAHVLLAEYTMEVIPLREDGPSVYSRAYGS